MAAYRSHLDNEMLTDALSSVARLDMRKWATELFSTYVSPHNSLLSVGGLFGPIAVLLLAGLNLYIVGVSMRRFGGGMVTQIVVTVTSANLFGNLDRGLWLVLVLELMLVTSMKDTNAAAE